MSKLTERLAKKIDTELGIKVDLQSFISIRPKTSYKLAGAWSWEMNSIFPKQGIVRVGSCWTATECARRNVKLYRKRRKPPRFSYGDIRRRVHVSFIK